MPLPNHLLIMRHADAEAHAADGQDVSRELTGRGLQQAAERRQVVIDAAPQLVLCSAATRAVQTLAGMGPLDTEVVVEDRLYTASTTSLLLRLGELPDAVSRVLVLGHLPTVGAVVNALLPEGLQRVAYSPSAIAHLELPDPWAALQPASARLLAWHP